MLIVPEIFKAPGLIAAQSTRQGGASMAPFASLNLSLLVGDDEEAVHRNKALFCEALGIHPHRLASGRQVHGDQVLRVSQPIQTEGYDALITNTPGVFLSVFIADCTPVLVYDPVQKACAAIHAGWHGTAAGIVQKTLTRMTEEFGTRPADCLAYIGACIAFDAFEVGAVGAEVAAHFAGHEQRHDASTGRFFVDLKTANKNQLLRAGLLEGSIEVSPYCTVTNHDLFFSHRLEKGLTGRMMAIIGMKA